MSTCFQGLVVPGGGLTVEGRPHPFVISRLEEAARLYHAQRGTAATAPKVFVLSCTCEQCLDLVQLVSFRMGQHLSRLVHACGPIGAGGTTHKPPPYDHAGFPITEAAASARVLIEEVGVFPSTLERCWVACSLTGLTDAVDE